MPEPTFLTTFQPPERIPRVIARADVRITQSGRSSPEERNPAETRIAKIIPIAFCASFPPRLIAWKPEPRICARWNHLFSFIGCLEKRAKIRVKTEVNRNDTTRPRTGETQMNSRMARMPENWKPTVIIATGTAKTKPTKPPRSAIERILSLQRTARSIPTRMPITTPIPKYLSISKNISAVGQLIYAAPPAARPTPNRPPTSEWEEDTGIP